MFRKWRDKEIRHQVHELELFADYFQFYVCDQDFETDTSEIWDEIATDRMLATGADLVAVGTARNMDVPVIIEISPDEPEADFDEWERIIECSIDIPSGTMLALGCTDYIGDASKFKVVPGTYSARVSYAGLDELSDDGLDGNDRYRLQFWPGEVREIETIKR